MTTITQPLAPTRSPKWWPWMVSLGIAWGLTLAVIVVLSDPTPENFTLAAAIWTAGLYTAGLRLTQRWWLPLLAKHPLRNAVLLGAFNAAVIETEFLVFEHLFGAEGVAAHPNLIVDLLMTMPWYIMMCLTFVRVQNRWRFSAATALFLGAIYEMGADGIVGQFMALVSGDFMLFTLEYWLTVVLMFTWAFIPVYSSMLLPPAWLIATSTAPPQPEQSPFVDALKPLGWLIPFTLYLIVFLLFMLAFSPGA